MKATELRIGNIIECYLGAPISESIESVVCADTFINFDKYPKTTYHPIPLTDEWLIKFGFEDSSSFGVEYYELGKITICQSDCLAYIEDLNGVEIKHVHQLQNLYFALTGEEFTLQH